jgi:sodium/potassium-transporting ATPase subunit alpha
LVSLIDPPRATVPGSVKECYAAGIQVFMVTGDHPETAHAIAKSIGLVTTKTKEEIIEEHEEAKQKLAEQGKPTNVDEKGEAWPSHDKIKGGAFVVHGQKLAEYKDEDWEYLFSHKEVVFARTQPIQKQTIVNKLKAKGHIVAMTGDGVNDAPALKAANAGLAMGSGTTVAKEAASIILMDDNFSSIVEGVREGRLIFENLKKCIAYVLSSNIPELLPFLFFIAAKVPLGLETVMILLVDLGTDLAPAVALAYEEPEAAIMQQVFAPSALKITSYRISP